MTLDAHCSVSHGICKSQNFLIAVSSQAKIICFLSPLWHCGIILAMLEDKLEFYEVLLHNSCESLEKITEFLWDIVFLSVI